MDEEPKNEPRGRRVTVRGLLDAGAVVTAVAALVGFVDSWWWIFDLFSHFRLQYLVVFSALTGWYLIRREWLKSGLATTGLIVNLAVVWPHWGGEAAPPPTADRTSVRLLWWNVHSQNRNYAAFYELIRQESPDVIALAEITPRWEQELEPLKRDYPHVLIRAREDNFGMALYSRLPLRAAAVVYHDVEGVPMIRADIVRDEFSFRLFAVHAVPPSSAAWTRERDEQLAWLAGRIAEYGKPVVVAGDLNTTPWNYAFSRLLDGSRLRDRSGGLQLTWPASFPPLYLPLDYCLTTPEIQVGSERTGPGSGSDHRPLLVELSGRTGEHDH